MKKTIAIIIAVFIIFSLVACNGGVPESPANEDNLEESTKENNEESPDKDLGESIEGKLELPEKKMLPMTLEGMEEEREATLNKSKYGYYIYILDGYTFNETDTGKSVITMNYDPKFNAEIELLAGDLDKETWQVDSKGVLSEFGEVHEIKPEEHFHEYFRDAEYYLLASSTKGSVIYMLHEVDNTLVQYKINIPSKEAAEGAVPSLWTMLKTIEIK